MNFLTLALAAAASLLLPASSSDQRLDHPQSEAAQSTEVRPRTSFQAVTANYTYDTEPSLDTVGNTRLIYEPGQEDDEGAACWFLPETFELALSGTVGKDGEIKFDDVPDLARCPPMD